MRFSEDHGDWFDAHRKDHRHRPHLLIGFLALNAVLWAGILALMG